MIFCTPPTLRAAQLALATFVTAVVVACSSDDQTVLPGPRTVLVAEVVPATQDQRRYSALLRAAARSDLAFEVSGPITFIDVELGDRVTKGQRLATLDDRSFRLELEARLANLADAEAELGDARLDYDRRAALKESGAVSQSAIDQAQTRLQRAEAQVSALQAEVANARERLSDTTLQAPFDGEITARLAEPAEVATVGRPILRMIGDDEELEAVVFVSGRTRSDLRLGETVPVQRTDSDARTTGVVTEIGAEANSAGLFPVTVRLREAAAGFRPGESVTAVLADRAQDSHVLIPLTAFIAGADNEAWVLVLDGSSTPATVVARPVLIAALRSDGAVVSEGLAAGEYVVAKGVELLSDGEAVQAAGVGPEQFNQ